MTKNTPFLINSIYFISNMFVALGFLLKGQSTKIANPAATSLFYLGIILLEHFTSFKLKNYIRLLLIFTLTSHSLFGEYFRAYYRTEFFDNALHFLGSFSFALLAYELLQSFFTMRSNHPTTLTVILVSALGISLGIFFELIEFSLDLLLKENNQNGLFDTNLDLVFDVIGSFSAGLFLVVKDRIFFKTL